MIDAGDDAKARGESEKRRRTGCRSESRENNKERR